MLYITNHKSRNKCFNSFNQFSDIKKNNNKKYKKIRGSNAVGYYSYLGKNAKKNLAYEIGGKLIDASPVFLCVGNSNVVGDCFGPLVGEILTNKYQIKRVFGTLKHNVTSKNLAEVYDFIKLKLPIRVGKPKFLGAIPQHFKKYKGKPKAGFELWMNRIQNTLMQELVPSLLELDSNIVSDISKDNVIVTKIPDFGSLAVCAQECGKAAFEVEQEDTALINNGIKWTGATWNDAKERMTLYEKEFEKIFQRLERLK